MLNKYLLKNIKQNIMKIKICILLIVTGFIFFTSCKNDDDNSGEELESTAEIKGLDLTLCACCGGWIIDIDGEEPDKRFISLPAESDIDLNMDDLPISVKLNWVESDDYCGKGITIQSIELVE